MFGFGPETRRWLADPNTRIAITGATGWIGQAFAAEAMEAGLTPENGRLRLFGAAPRTVTIADRPVAIEALSAGCVLGDGDWLFVHCAFLGKERLEDLDQGTFRIRNDAILAAALRLAETAEMVRMVFTSSGAVYGPDRSLVRGPDVNLYGAMKAEHEERLGAWASRHARPLAMARVFNIGGPYSNKPDRYALSSLISAISDDPTVRIMAERPVFRSFVHVRELVAVMAEASLVRADAAPFDTTGRETIEIEDLAGTIASVLGKAVSIQRKRDWTADVDWYVGDARDYQTRVARLGRPVVDLPTIIADTAGWLAGTAARSANVRALSS